MKKLQEKLEKNFASGNKNKPRLSSQNSCEIMETDDEDDFNELKKLALETLVLNKINFAENSAEQRNFPVAVKNLKEIYKVCSTYKAL